MEIKINLPSSFLDSNETTNPESKASTSYQGNPLDDPNFKDDLRRHFWSKGRQFENDDDMVKEWYSERTYANLNSAGMVADTAEAYGANEEERARAKRLQDAYNKMPLFFEDGGAIDRVGGWETAKSIVGALVLDPINLIPFGKAATAANMARLSGKTTAQAYRAGALSGALTQGAVEAGVGGAMSGLQQTRDVRLGLQDEISMSQVGSDVALSGVLGAGMGGLVGLLASRTGIKAAEQSIDAMLGQGLTADQILDIPRDRLKTIIETKFGPIDRKALNEYMRETNLGPYATQRTGPEAKPSTDFVMEPEMTEAERIAAEFDEDLAGIEDDLSVTNPEDPEYDQLLALRNSRLTGKIILGQRDKLQGEAEAAIAAGDDKKANELLTRINNAERELRMIRDGKWADTEAEAAADEVTADPKAEGETPTKEDGQATEEAAQETERRTPFSAVMKARLQGMPEFAGADINGVKDAQKLIRRVAKAQFGIEDADSLDTETLYYRMTNHADQREAGVKDMTRQALEDYLEEVSLNGSTDEVPFQQFLGERDTYASNKEAILQTFRESSKTEAESKQIVSKMLDEDDIDPDDLAVGDEDDLIDEIDAERAASKAAGANDRATARAGAESVRQGYESDQVMGELRHELLILVQEAKRQGVEITPENITHYGRQARQELANIESRNAMVKLVSKRGGDPLLDANLQTQWVINHVRNSIEAQMSKGSTGRKNIRGNTDSLERQSQFATDEVVADKARKAAAVERQRQRFDNLKKLPQMVEAKATVLATKQPTPFVADTRVTYLNASGELVKARRGDKVFAVVDPNRPGQVAFVDTPESAAILMGRKPDVTAKRIVELTTTDTDAPQLPSLDSDAMKAPSGFALALVKKSPEQGKHTVRLVSNAQMQQAQAGKRTLTARNLLGKADANEWDVVWLSTKNSLPYEKARSGRAITPRQLADMVWQPDAPKQQAAPKLEHVAGSTIDTWANAKGKRFPLAATWQADFFKPTGVPAFDRRMADLERTLIESGMLGDGDLSVEGLYLSRVTLDSNIPWSDPKVAAATLDKLDQILVMEERLYPRGLLLPNGERVKAMRALNELMADYDHKTTKFVWDTLNRVAIAHPDGKVPNIEKTAGAPHYSVYSQKEGFNTVRLPDADRPDKRPRPYALLHELMHWGYANILTPSERRLFVNAVRGRLETGTIGDILPTSDTGLTSNVSHSLNEIFAEAGAGWAMNNREATLLDQSFWVALAEKIRAVFERIINKGKASGIKEDPVLNELFARILPDNEQIIARLGLPDGKVFDDAQALLKQVEQVKTKGSKESLAIRAKALAELEQFDQVFDDLALDPDQWPSHVGQDSQLGMALFNMRNVFTFKNKDGKTLPNLHYAKDSQQRAHTIINELGTLRDSPEAIEQSGTMTGETYLEYVKKTGNHDPALFMRDVLFNPNHPSSVPYAVAIMKQGLRDAMLAEHGVWVGRDAMPTSQTAWNYALAQKARHAVKGKKPTAEPVVPVEKLPEPVPEVEAVTEQANLVLGKETPSVEVDPALIEQVKAGLAKTEAAQEVMKETVKTVNKKRRERVVKTAGAVNKVQEIAEKPARASHAPVAPQAAESAPTVKRQPTAKLADKVVEVKPDEIAKDHEAMADEMIRRARMIKSMVGKKRVEITLAQYRATRNELREQYINALKMADQPTLDQIEWVYAQRAAAKVAGSKAGLGRAMLGSEIIEADVYQMLKPKFSGKVATKAVARELEDSRGVAETGIMPSAPANIRAIQMDMTHRDPQTAHDMRTVFYRLLALTDKVTRNLPANVIDNLAGVNQSPAAVMASTGDEAFKTLRNALRRDLTALRKDGDYEGALSNIGQMVARAINGHVDASAINKVFASHGESGNVTQWFINQWKVVASGQKGLDTLTENVDVFTAGKFNEAMGEFAESMAYVLRGTIDRADIYQKYRWLGAYGDPLQPDTVRTLADLNKDGVGAAVAQLHAYDYLDNLDIHAKVGMARWVGGPIRPLYVSTREATGSKSGPLGRAFYTTDRPSTLGLDPEQEFATLAPEVAEVAREYAHALAGVRNAIAEHRRSMELLEPNDVEGSDRAGDKLTDLLASEAEWLERFDALGVRAPSVQVVVTRAKHTIDLTGDTVVEGNSPLVGGIIDMAERLGLSHTSLSNLADAIVRDQSGPDFVASMEAWITKEPSLRARKGDVLREFLSGMGFDSAMIGKGDETRMAVFNPSDIRSMMDDFEPMARTDRFNVEGNPMRHANAALVKGEPVNVPEIVAAMEDQGLPRRAGDALIAAAKGRKMSKTDEQALKPFQFKELFTELSVYMRANKAKWVADWIKPEDGGGIFERLDSEMGAQLMPVIEQLKKLEGNETFFGRALNAIRPNKGQPASFSRVVMALRLGDSTGLKPEEVKAFTMIRDTFAREWQLLVNTSLANEDGGIRNYFPQVWDIEKLESNRDEFIKRLANFLMDSHTAETGMPLSQPDALYRATGIYDNLIGNDGVYSPASQLKGTASEHVDAARVLRLHEHPGHMMAGRVGEFLQDDLEGVLVKYFQGTTRRRLFHEQFGQGNHAFHDFMQVLVDGDNGAFELLTSGKTQGFEMKGAGSDGLEARFPTFKPLFTNSTEAWQALDEVKTIIKRDGKENAVRYLKQKDDNPNMERRIRAIVEALAETDGKRNKVPENVRKNMVAMFESVEGKNPYRHTPGFKWKNAASHGLRSFNSITLLGSTILSSMSDAVMPLVNSGDFKAYVKGIAHYARDPEYRVAMRNIGVAMENLVHNRMAHLYGQDAGKLTNAFFNATLLTPWTDMWRGIAGSVAMETFKAEQRRALSSRTGDAGRKHAVQFLRRYGLASYIQAGDLSSAEVMNDPKVRQAVLRFTNEAVFAPNPNDIPLWAKSPVGSLVYQFKTFPMMMGRMGLRVAKSGRLGSQVAFLGALPLAGAASLAVKDVLLSRGGEDQQSMALRDRDAGEWVTQAVLQAGALGILADVLSATTEQLDNGAYGRERVASTFLGPSYGLATDVMKVAAGLVDVDPSNSKEREGTRALLGRVPVVGRNANLREGTVDAVAGVRQGPDGGGEFDARFKAKFDSDF